MAIIFQKFIRDLACGAEGYDKLGALADLTFNANGASHLLDKLLTYAQAQADTVAVDACVFFDGVEVDKELRNALLWHAAAEILNNDVKRNEQGLLLGGSYDLFLILRLHHILLLILKLQIIDLKCNDYSPILARKFYRVWQEVDQYLHVSSLIAHQPFE